MNRGTTDTIPGLDDLLVAVLHAFFTASVFMPPVFSTSVFMPTKLDPRIVVVLTLARLARPFYRASNLARVRCMEIVLWGFLMFVPILVAVVARNTNMLIALVIACSLTAGLAATKLLRGLSTMQVVVLLGTLVGGPILFVGAGVAWIMAIRELRVFIDIDANFIAGAVLATTLYQ